MKHKQWKKSEVIIEYSTGFRDIQIASKHWLDVEKTEPTHSMSYIRHKHECQVIWSLKFIKRMAYFKLNVMIILFSYKGI